MGFDIIPGDAEFEIDAEDLNPLKWINKANHAFGDTLASNLEFLGITDPAVDPDGIREIAKQWRALAKGLDAAARDAETALKDLEWEGKAAKALHKRAKTARTQATDMADSLRKGAKALDDFADEAHALLTEIGVILAEIAEFEIAGLALSVLTGGLSAIASSLAAGARAAKVVALITRIEKSGSRMARVIRTVMEAIRGLERALKALGEIKTIAKAGKLAGDGMKFAAFDAALRDPGTFKDPGKLSELLATGAAFGVGAGVLGKVLGKGLGKLKPSELAKLSKSLGIGGKDLSRLKLRPDQAQKVQAAIRAAEKECKLDPIDVATGAMLLPQTDVELPGALPLILERTHISSYQWGGWFGPSWASTLDQRLQADDDGIIYATPDGSRLVYPNPAPDSSEPVYPETGTRIPLKWDTEVEGALRITNPATGLSYVFHSPQATDNAEGVDLPLQAIENRHRQRITIHYGDDATPVEVTHSGGYRIALDRHPHIPRIAALRLLDPERPVDRGTVLVSYGYDDDGHLTEVGDSAGKALQFTYDPEGRITSWTDRNANTYSYTYDEQGRVIRTEGIGGYLSGTLNYDEATRTTTVTNGLGHSTRYEHNEAYRLIRETDPLGHTTHQEWDGEGRLVAVTDPLGKATRHCYDDLGQLVSVIHPDGQQTFCEYDGAGLPVTITGPDGGVWRQEYDEYGNRTAVTDPSGARTVFSYTSAGQLGTVTDALGHTTAIRHSRADLPLEVTDPTGAVTAYVYDAMGRPTAITDPLGHTTRLRWTVEGQLVRRTAPDGSSESWTYDAVGNCTSHTDPSGGVTRFEYADFDLLAVRTAPDNARYTFTHDTELRLTQVTNPQGLCWSYNYDPAGRLVSETDFDGRTLTYTYDAAGRFTSRATPLGQVISYELDGAGRTVAKNVEGDLTTYTYNVAGHLTEASTSTSTLALERDVLGRVLAESVDGHTTRYTYDVLGRRTSRTTPSGVCTQVSRNAAGVPTAVSVGEHHLTFERDALGRETSRVIESLTAPITLTSTWDEAGRQSTQHLATANRILRSRAYTYRADSTLTQIADQLSGEQRKMTLDAVGRPLAVTAGRWTETYAYDTAGNQTAAQWPAEAPHPDARGERIYTGTRIRTAGTVRYEYDAAGRATLRQKTRLSGKPATWRYVYDAEDHLVSCTTPDGTTWTYSYDPLGRRTAKYRTAPDSDQPMETVRFSWDGTSLSEQTDTTTGTVITWEYDDDHPVAQLEHKPAAVTTPLAATSEGDIDTRFFAIVTDLVGTPTELVSQDGTVAWHTQATLWGRTSWNRDATAYTPLRFPGQYADPETGLHYNFFRHYDPDAARYTTPDPFGLVPAPNPVTYTHNPQTWSDPLGLVPKACLIDRYKWDGSVRFGKLDDLNRPTGVFASLRNEMLDTGSPAGSTWTPGWRGHGTSFNEARGHLLANRLGGPGKGSLSRQNLVTLTQDPVNTPVMREIEDKVYRAVAKGENVQYSVVPKYEGTNPVPTRLEISAYGNRGFSLTEKLENPAAGVRAGTIPIPKL
ncbi:MULTISPECIES: DUF6531 domain-containing protein [unclassified Streptomyces]|uniref:DUF6531 domain-containing protein n=1 Tax=unclassified Streptomyces TaxID=2593676 RepID=UPI001369D528|nr:hypothetical protein [Streptomyces sp. SID335]MYZ11788.1 hypothetical protein [Streptomyces sp. SID337]NDZ85841.1 hypothetical protein [Streptomyces sp. SID10115]NEA02873.1 hypothetical protein [Streptomyces sp. SID10116]NEB45734.1 hypothetical protein [Streptomyces sp. SID339]